MSEEDSERDKVLLSSGKVLTVSTASDESIKPEDSDGAVVDRVRNVWGSSSGAGSDFLDKYRKQRAVEMSRLEEMDKKWKEDMENKLFHSQRMYRIKKETDKRMKRKLKREKRKKKNASPKEGEKTTDSDQKKSAKNDDPNLKSNEKHVESKNGKDDVHYVSNVSDQKISETSEDETKDSSGKKSRLIIVDNSTSDF